MKLRRSLSVLALALGALTLAGRDAPVHAQGAPVAFKGTAAEDEAYKLLKDNKLLAARTKAEAILEKNPDSILGNFVLGNVLRDAEGDLARAMYRMGRARKLFEDVYGSSPPQSSPWQLHREMLYTIQALAGEMEEYEYQLQILDFHDGLYDPHLIAEHAWPLLRLGKFDEARKVARLATSSSDPYELSVGRNALCAIEGEARERKAYFEACTSSLDYAKKSAVKGTIPVVQEYNAALAAYAVGRLDEVERFAKEGSLSRPISIANPWRILTRLYTDGGRPAEAIAAARQMQSWRAHQAASLRDQDRAETDAALSSLLLVAGESVAAGRLIERAIERPDRRGLVSTKPDQALGAHALLRRAIARASAEQMAERSSWSGTAGKPKASAQIALARIASWPDDERLVSILGNRERLDSTFRVYLSGGIEPVPSWLVGDLIDVLGAGIVGVSIAKARKEEKDLPALVPYFDGLEAEVELKRGNEKESIALARKAIAALPKGEAILAARIAAVGGEAARRNGDRTATLALLEQALQKDAGVVRRLGLAIPAKISGNGDASVQRAVTLLGRSPRLRDADWGFTVKVTKDPNGVKICLGTPNGTTLSCATAVVQQRKEKDKEPPETADDWGARAVEEFHKEAFAMHVGMTSKDLDSLDGSTTVASQAQREMMKGVLTDVAKDSAEEP